MKTVRRSDYDWIAARFLANRNYIRTTRNYENYEIFENLKTCKVAISLMLKFTIETVVCATFFSSYGRLYFALRLWNFYCMQPLIVLSIRPLSWSQPTKNFAPVWSNITVAVQILLKTLDITKFCKLL